jgi:hypothetical protein
MRDLTHTDGPDSQRAVAAYLADMTADLARMARGQGLDVLGYLLDMVRLEARSVAGEFDSDEPAA